MKEIQLTQGKVALVDDEDFERLSKFNWNAHFNKGNWYAATGRGETHWFMHEMLLSSNLEKEHIDGNGLNNQKHNLRLATHKQNCQNRKLNKNSTSGFKGVSWNIRAEKWLARITIDGRTKSLGYYSSKEEAAEVYNKAATKHFGQFAKLNTVTSSLQTLEEELDDYQT